MLSTKSMGLVVIVGVNPMGQRDAGTSLVTSKNKFTGTLQSVHVQLSPQKRE